jgi:hypothetical protein
VTYCFYCLAKKPHGETTPNQFHGTAGRCLLRATGRRDAKHGAALAPPSGADARRGRGNLRAVQSESGFRLIDALSQTLHAMGVRQYLLAFLFLGCYALTLSQLIGTRGRHYAGAGAATAAIAFAALTDPWEHGVLVAAVALVAVGLFAGSAWLLWALFGWPHDEHLAWRHAPHDVVEETPVLGHAAPLAAAALTALVAALRRPGKLLMRAEEAQR